MKPTTIARGLVLTILACIFWAGGAYALKYPHNSQKSIACSSCHYAGFYLKVKTKSTPCLDSNCHQPGAAGPTSAKRKALPLQYASNVFGNFTNGSVGKKPVSHAWSVNQINPSAGATKQLTPIGNKASTFAANINCSRCHLTHGTTVSGYPQSFLRHDKRGDGICLSCHAARQVGAGSARTYPPASGKHYSHPVEVNYSSIRADRPEYFEATPLMTGGYNESARLRLYTAYNFVNGVKGTVKAVNAVICSTCHGPLHSADSNPYTFDNMSAASFGNFSFNTADGYLLRRYNSKKSNNICTSCHKVQTHQTATKCSDCHVPHKGPGDNNIFLIRTSIQTPNSGKRSVQFISTTEMADRWRNQGAADGISNAICQVCHTATASHRNYSSAGVPRETSKMGEYHGGGKYKNCAGCHSHANGFPKSGGGCNGCHGASDGSTAYPSDVVDGKHQKHIGTGSASYSWSAGTLSDSRSAGAYGLSCGRCHSPFARYTDSQHFAGAAAGNYTTDIGFKHKSILPNNTGASYLYGATGGSDPGRNTGASWRFPGTGPNDGLCRNLYCHGQFYNGYTGFNPNWEGTAPCGKCHGATQELGRGLPGNMKNTTNYGAHPRHVGGATEQGYGQGTANFRCNACHALSATQNAISSVGLDRRYHVNGRINVKFDAPYGNGTYNNLSNYTAAVSIAVTKPAYKTCGLIYCHSDGSRTAGNYSTSSAYNRRVITYPNWSSSKNFTSLAGTTTKMRCARCHGADKALGVTAYNGITSAMPGYGGAVSYIRSDGKRNSHWKHVVVNGFMCNVCHFDTVNTDNRSIKDTTKHVNKTYDVSFISKYNAGGAIYNDLGDKTCAYIKCHGGRRSAPWGQSGTCQDCHFKSSAEVSQDEGYSDNYAFKNYTDATSVPRVYSTEWAGRGHGSSAAAKLPKVCTDCHKASGSISHKSEIQSNNQFRVFTSPAHLDDLCLECHTDGRSKSAQADKKVLGHNAPAMGGWGDATWAFIPKCIDCHDPHGDNNRYMIQKFVNITGSDTYGKIANSNYARQVTFTTVGGGLINWSSYVKSDFSGICQRCHNTQANLDHFNKNTLYDNTHNAQSRCTGCHKHDSGFKGMDCAACHNFPPTLSGKHAFHVATTVAKSYVSYDVNSTKTKYAFACGKCHNSGTHYVGLSGNYTTEVKFDNANYPKNDINGYVFGVRSSIDQGADGPSGYSWTSTKGTCQNLYCHGEFAGGNTGNDPLWYGNSVCGNCHGATQASAPSGGAHGKHVNVMGYDCRNCHDDTVDAGVNTPNLKNKVIHVDGKTQYKLYTAWSQRIGGAARYNGNIFGRATTEIGSATYGFCQNIYCHSKGTNTTNPYNVASAYPNYTAKWGQDMVGNFPNAGERCSYCHGSRKTAGGYAGITSAMPNYPTGSPKINSHKKHVVDNGFSCYACHAATVGTDGRSISTPANHANQVYNVNFPSKYDAGGASYASSKCSNIKCHGGRLTPAWGQSSINCSDCHYSNSTDVMDYTFRNYTDTASVPKIYSGEWKASGHGKSGANYNRTNNPPAGKICNTCHVSSVKHNTGSNFFRLTGLGGGTDPSTLCKRCHGTSTERQTGWFGNRTGIQGHTQQILSSSGYTNLTTWRFQPKCTDCHDPHGDAQASSGNIAMIRNTYLYNYSGSDSAGRPIRFGSLTTAVFEKYTGTKSFDNGDATKGRLCAACHKRAAHNGGPYTGHNNQGLDCRSCHKHKQGFNPSGCNGCHGDSAITIDRANWAPPKGPTGWSDSLTNMSSLHRPHAYNPKSRPGFGNQTGFACQYCHDDSMPSTVNHNTDKNLANLNNMTSTTGWNGMTKASKVDYGTGVKNPANDTCSNTKCHTPRAYIRTWQKPKDCDDCHGYTKGRGTSGLTGRQFNLQTTQSHKIHINWTANAPAWKKNYKFACKNCHYDWQTNNNYSTHYSGQVNITSSGPVNTVGAAFYTRGRAFKGFTSGNESLGTCSKTYCHGNFTNGTAITKPNWKKGATPVNCGSCHRAKTGKVAGWGTGALMPAPHPTHVNSATYNFTCARCHNWTVTNNTTVQFTYSTHVNTRKDVNFDNTSGTFTNSSKRMCQNNYCHSGGATVVPRTVSNYTADWLDGAAVNKTGAGKGCSYCHGSKGNGFGGITAAMPNYANQAHAKHARNATGDSFRCNACHASTVDAAGVILNNGNHVNKFKNISIISTYKSGQTAYSTTVSLKKTCKNIKCHGGRTTPLWTLTTGINCMDCHKSMAGDTDKRIKEANVFQSFSETAPKIYSTAWATRGHGRPTAEGVYLISGNSPADKTCTNCHGAGEVRAGGLLTKHGNNANPFRLITAPDRPNMICNKCHGIGGSATRSGILTHASSVSKQGQNFDIKCIDCHDPHGDNNIYMVHSTVVRPNNALSVKSQISNLYGNILINATTARNVDFVNNIYTSDYGKKSQATKICQTCHRETQKPRSSTVGRFRWNGSQDEEHGTSKCTGCHSHDQGFKGVRCDGCHGNPPTSIQTILSGAGRTNQGNERPSATSGAGNTAGAHSKHVQVFGGDGVTCSYCHQGGMYGNGTKNLNIDIGFKAFAVYSGYTQNYNGQAAVKSGFYGYSGYGVGSGTNQKCNNMKCHGGGGWLTASYGTVTAPTWTAPNSATCGKCHGAKKATSSGSWPTTYAHSVHAGTGSVGANLMCNVCHATTVIANNTTLSDTMHVNGRANIGFGNEFRVHSTTSAYSDDGNYVNNNVAGKCQNTYCHSKGTDTDMIAPFNNAADYANWTATWNDGRGSYRQATANIKAKCNYCHGNKNYTGILAAAPRYNDGSPKANKHPKHVETYRFLCNACHVDVARNNTSITSSSLHINRSYDINYTTVRTIVNNSAGSYNTGRCENVYCHSSGNIAASSLPNYTAKWSSNLGGYKTGQKCKFCHGAKSIPFTGMTAAMPNYPTGAKANAHNRHVAKYGFTCTECHMKVTANNSSIDAAGGIGLHVNKQYDVYFKPAIAGRPQINNTGIYKYKSGATGSSCKNTYCHSRGTDFVRPYSTRTSFSNFTAQWGDNVGGYKKPAGQKAKCNYCHGNKVYSGSTSAMPNYSTQIKKNSHKRHVVGYAFTCKACHKYVTNNNSSIDAAGGIGRHVNGSYNVDFSNSFNNNTGLYEFSGLNSLNKCKNMYCHSRGTDFIRPFNTRTSFANFTARWGEDLGSLGYKKPAGQKAKCNYCHGNRAYAGTTSAMPNYSGNFNFVKAKANSHRVHVIGNGLTCKECHYGVVPNNTSISDRVRHTNAFYNISFAPGRRGEAGKMYSSVWGSGNTQGTLGGTCMNNKCHGTSKPKWGDPATASCKACHLSSSQTDVDSYGKPNDDVTARIYSSEWGQKGHGKFGIGCDRCHKSTVVHNYAQSPLSNPFRLMTSRPDPLCLGCHGSATEKMALWNEPTTTNIDYKTHSKANAQSQIAASWNNYTGQSVKCIDCHDPHGDKNRKMIQLLINYTGSDRYGRPVVTPTTQMTFTTLGGQYNWSSFANNDVNKSICRRCHTPYGGGAGQDSGMGDGSGGNMTKANYAGNHQAVHQACTECHDHKAGFKGAGACNSCHGYPPAPGDGKAYKDSPVNEGKGAHPSHIAHLQTVKNVTLAPATDQFGAGTARKICGTCHTNSSGNHQTGGRVINFGDFTTENQFASVAPFYNGSTFKSGTSITANRPKNCSNVRCHFQNSPRWQNITAVGD